MSKQAAIFLAYNNATAYGPPTIVPGLQTVGSALPYCICKIKTTSMLKSL